MIPPRQSPPFRRALLASLLCVSISGCDDPKREQQLQWREEEVEGQKTAIAKREQPLLPPKASASSRSKAQIAAREAVGGATQEATATGRGDRENEESPPRDRDQKPARPHSADHRRSACIVIDAETDDVLFEKNPDKRGAIASTTKIMTGLLVVEAGDLDKVVTVELSDTQCAPVRIGLKVGETYTRRQLLTAMMVKSSNDIAQALARDNAGSVAAFADKMNARAPRRSACKNTLRQSARSAIPHG